MEGFPAFISTLMSLLERSPGRPFLNRGLVQQCCAVTRGRPKSAAFLFLSAMLDTFLFLTTLIALDFCTHLEARSKTTVQKLAGVSNILWVFTSDFYINVNKHW